MENLGPHIAQKVSKEINSLLKCELDDIQVILNERDLSDIQSDINGPVGTPYEGGIFRLRLRLTNLYPTEPPKAFFVTKIFHPNIAPSSGEVCVNTLKKDWHPELGIKHVLLAIRCLLIEPNAESALNEEAGRMLLDQYDEYASRARLHTEIHAVCNNSRNNSNAQLSHISSISQLAQKPDSDYENSAIQNPILRDYEQLTMSVSKTKKALKRL